MKTYIYRKHLIEPIKPALGLLGVVVTLFLVYGTVIYLTINSISKNEFFMEYALGLLVIIVSFLIILGLTYIFYFKKFKNMSILLGHENLIYKKNEKSIAIAYKDIINIEFPKIRLMSGEIKIKSKDSFIRISVDIDNVSELIKEIKGNVEKYNSNVKINDKDFYDFYVNACYSDDSWHRIYDFLRFLPPFLAINIILVFIFSFLVYDQNIKLVISALFMLWPVLSIVVAELILFIKQFYDIKKNIHNVNIRNNDFEIKVYSRVILSLAIIITICLVYFLRTF